MQTWPEFIIVKSGFHYRAFKIDDIKEGLYNEADNEVYDRYEQCVDHVARLERKSLDDGMEARK